jgi:hypothetical protein
MASRYEEVVPPEHIRQFLIEALDYFRDADKRESTADERAKRIAQAHSEGWKLVARAINDGFSMVARAVEGRR